MQVICGNKALTIYPLYLRTANLAIFFLKADEMWRQTKRSLVVNKQTFNSYRILSNARRAKTHYTRIVTNRQLVWIVSCMYPIEHVIFIGFFFGTYVMRGTSRLVIAKETSKGKPLKSSTYRAMIIPIR